MSFSILNIESATTVPYAGLPEVSHDNFYSLYVTYELKESNNQIYRIVRLWNEGDEPIDNVSKEEMLKCVLHSERVDRKQVEQTSLYRLSLFKFLIKDITPLK